MTVIYCVSSTEIQVNEYSKKVLFSQPQKFRYGETNLLLLPLLIPISLFPDCLFTAFLYYLCPSVTHSNVSIVRF